MVCAQKDGSLTRGRHQHPDRSPQTEAQCAMPKAGAMVVVGDTGIPL
jgi:hypothetical protein